MAAGTTKIEVTSSAPTAGSAATAAKATSAEQREVRPLERQAQRRRAGGVEGRPRSTRGRAGRRRPRASAAATAENARSPPSSPIAVPNSSRSTDALDSNTSLARITPTPSAATSRRPVAASPGSRPARPARSAPPAYPSASPSAATRGLNEAACASTEPGKVAVPTAWVKNAIRRSTTKAPSSPPASASSASSSSAVRVLRSSNRSAGLGRVADIHGAGSVNEIHSRLRESAKGVPQVRADVRPGVHTSYEGFQGLHRRAGHHRRPGELHPSPVPGGQRAGRLPGLARFRDQRRRVRPRGR